MPLFWNHVVFTLKVMTPLLHVLHLVDGERKTTMGYIYKVMEKANETIMKSLNNNKVNTRYGHANLITPYKLQIDCMVVSRDWCQVKMLVKLSLYKSGNGLFGDEFAKESRKTRPDT